MNPVVWFEIPVLDMTRAKTFYENVFDLSLSLADMGPHHMARFPADEKAPGASGALVQGEMYEPCATGHVIYFHVADISGVLEKARKMGGTIQTPKTAIGQYGFYGLFKDSEGNCIGLHSMK